MSLRQSVGGDDCPCIGSCTTVLGDDVCRGCLRTFDEITAWPALNPADKIAINKRIKLEITAKNNKIH